MTRVDQLKGLKETDAIIRKADFIKINAANFNLLNKVSKSSAIKPQNCMPRTGDLFIIRVNLRTIQLCTSD
jgi:hypothetical protein